MKNLFFMILAIWTGILFAGVETIELPPLTQWEKTPSTRILQKEKVLIPLNGTLTTVREYPVKYGDCIEVVVLYSGKGRLRFQLNELDKNLACTASSGKTFALQQDERHSHSAFFNISKKETTCFNLEIQTAGNENMGIETISCRRFYGEENALYSPYLNRELWAKRTQGKNLALGRKAAFRPEPDYSLTRKGGTDASDLTDGKFSTRYENNIWFDPAAVGWKNKAKRRLVSIDLGSVQNVSKAVVRICGGRINAGNDTWFPGLLEVWVSRDGGKWYPASSLKKVKISEKQDADWKTLYFLPESNQPLSPTYVYPFELPVNAEARYVGFGFSDSCFLLLDEIAVMEGKRDQPGFNAAYTGKPDQDLFSDNATVEPFYPEMYVHRGSLHLPTMFKFNDRRTVKEGSLSYFIDLPEQISYTEGLGYPAFTRKLIRTETRNGRTIRYFQCSHQDDRIMLREVHSYHIGPFYFRAEKDIPASERYVRIGTTAGKKNVRTVVRDYKLNVIDIPQVRQPKHLMISFAWFWPRITAFWPEFGKSAQYLGINGTGWFAGHVPANKREAFQADLRKHQIKIIGVPRTNIGRLAGSSQEHLCVSAKRSAVNSVCPGYRGKYYEMFCSELYRSLKDEPLDMIYLDYELWFEPDAFRTCSRCDALRRSKKMSWAEYSEWAMADFYRGVIQAARKAKPKAVIGSYLYCLNYKNTIDGKAFPIFGTGLLYPSDLDELQPSYYGSNPAMISQRLRENYLKTRDPAKITLYLTAGIGAYGTDQMGDLVGWELFEAYMNGAHSIAYFLDSSFSSPVDFMYMAAALKVIEPYDEFLMKAELDPAFTGSDRNLVYTFRRLGKKALILTGNYGALKDARTVLPVKDAVSAKDCITGKAVAVGRNGIELTVPKGKAVLLEVNFR